MKKRLLYLVLLISFFSFSQAPTNGLKGECLFTNGSYATTSGVTITTSADRNGTPVNAIDLNATFLFTPQVNLIGRVSTILRKYCNKNDLSKN